MDALYENIKKLRQQKKMSQLGLAKEIGYADHTIIVKIEKGQVDLSFSKIKQFANVFGVTVSELIGE